MEFIPWIRLVSFDTMCHLVNLAALQAGVIMGPSFLLLAAYGAGTAQSKCRSFFRPDMRFMRRHVHDTNWERRAAANHDGDCQQECCSDDAPGSPAQQVKSRGTVKFAPQGWCYHALMSSVAWRPASCQHGISFFLSIERGNDVEERIACGAHLARCGMLKKRGSMSMHVRQFW